MHTNININMHIGRFYVWGMFFGGIEALASSSSCVCTTVPCPVEGKNYLNAGGGGEGVYTYSLNDDGIAVVASAEVTISSVDLDHGTDTTSCTQSYSRTMDDDGVEDCDAGHILAHRLGGYGNQTINIFPQDISVNRGAFNQFEDSIYDCIESGATSAKLSWTFAYEDTTKTKPDKVDYDAIFTGGDCLELNSAFTN